MHTWLSLTEMGQKLEKHKRLKKDLSLHDLSTEHNYYSDYTTDQDV